MRKVCFPVSLGAEGALGIVFTPVVVIEERLCKPNGGGGGRAADLGGVWDGLSRCDADCKIKIL